MRANRGGPVVVDTGVFGARLMPHGQLLASGYDTLIEGRPVIISFITVAELRFGALNAGWGSSRRQRLESHIRSARVAWPDQGLVDAYAALRVWCSSRGHGLGHKEHEADRWIAATAMYLGIPLIAHDAIFVKVDGLELLTRL
jgi:predicted nucleic acid-binding protein